MNRRIARLAGVGLASTTISAMGLLGVSIARGEPTDRAWASDVAVGGPAPACAGIPDADRALRAGCAGGGGIFRGASWYGGDFGGEYEAYEDYLRARDRYEVRTGRYDFDDRRSRERDRDLDRDRHGKRSHRHHDRDRTDAWVDGNYFGLSPYQDSWVAGLLEGSDWGQDFVIPYSHPGHPLANFPRPASDPSYTCVDPGTGTPYRCVQGGPAGPGAPGAPGSPSNPAPGSPAPGSPGTPDPGSPPVTSAPPPGTSRPNAPTTTRPLVPPASLRPTVSGRPSAQDGDDSGIPVVVLLLVFLASAGSVGAGYLMLRRRSQNPLVGG